MPTHRKLSEMDEDTGRARRAGLFGEHDKRSSIDTDAEATDHTDAKRGSRSRRRALAVGINDYQGSANDLPSCVNDVDAFVAMLRDDYSFDSITRLVDAQATVANVTAALQTMFAGATPDDRLVFFYSGHGSTSRQAGVMEECLVLYDGYLLDDTLSRMTQALPSGILTLVIDSCYSGGLEKRLLAPVFMAKGVAERAQVKAYTRPTHNDFVDHVREQDQARAVKRFGESVIARKSSTIGNPFEPVIGFETLAPAPVSDEIRQTQVNAVLLSACLETETAAASTSTTEGKSAFTFALLRSLKKLGPGTSMEGLVEATQSMIKSIGLTQTPLLKEPQLPAGLRLRTFITLDESKSAGTPGAPSGLMQVLANILKQAALGELNMDASALVNLLLNVAGKDYRPPEQKLFGIDDAILIPAIVSVVTSAIKGQQPADKSPLGDIIRIAGGLIKGQPVAEQKPFGIDETILMPYILHAIKSQQPTDKSVLGDALRTAGALIKGQQPVEQKLFGIDDAILIPAIVSVVTSAIKGQQPAGKSDLGDLLRTAGALIKTAQPRELERVW
jgi:hypothetical protein